MCVTGVKLIVRTITQCTQGLKELATPLITRAAVEARRIVAVVSYDGVLPNAFAGRRQKKPPEY